jgi:hypothetical protein
LMSSGVGSSSLETTLMSKSLSVMAGPAGQETPATG